MWSAKGDIRAQAKQVFENLPGYVEVRLQYLANRDHAPASTTVGIPALVNPDLLLEVEARAIAPDNRK